MTEEHILRAINVKDRLPEKSGDYLVKIKDYNKLQYKYFSDRSKEFFNPGTSIVTHWYEELSISEEINNIQDSKDIAINFMKWVDSLKGNDWNKLEKKLGLKIGAYIDPEILFEEWIGK